MSDKKVRVRFAPSPTGPLHMGGVRTALFNYLFAKQNGGDFILRIEDTDQNRFVEGAEQYIIESLKWCGMKFDEGPEEGGAFGPYRQSERKEMYKSYADELINAGFAYYAFDTPEELDKVRMEYEAEKKTFAYNADIRNSLNNSLSLSKDETQKKLDAGEAFVIRFKMPDSADVNMKDIIRGDVKVNSATLDDKVLYKSDGMPTYHLANIVDDHLMEITHVIRGEEWLPSMPLHVLLYRAFGWDEPQFAHLPLLLKPTGNGKLSKRDGDKLGFPVFPLLWNAPNGETAKGYREEGYFADAFVNLLALLGWNPGTEEEIFTMEELIQKFSLDRVNKSGARFDPEKAKWFNHQYMKKQDSRYLSRLIVEKNIIPIEEYCNSELNRFLLNKDGLNINKVKLSRIVRITKERTTFIKDFELQTKYFYIAPKNFDPIVIKKRWKEGMNDHIAAIKQLMSAEENFTATVLETKVKSFIEEKELNMGQIMNSLRLCLVGSSMGPSLMEIAEIIGKEETLLRLQNGIDKIRN